jgi:hypothetical protein
MLPHNSRVLGKIASDKWALSGVLVLWVTMLSVALGCVAMYGRNVPWREDWHMVPALVGQERYLPEWLWAQNNEHRLPFPKAVYLILLKISSGDFRIGMIANTLMLAGLCLAMILTARRIRGGQTRLADTFFPLALLHLGHWENMVWGWDIVFVIPTVLVCVWLLTIVRSPWPLPPKTAVTAGLTTVLLPLSGASGLIFTPFAALWLAAGMLLYRRDMTGRWTAPFQSACVIVSIVLTGLYFIGWASSASAFPNPGLRPTMLTSARFIGIALGPVGGGTGRVFPKSIIGVVFCGVAALLLATGIVPLRRGLRSLRPTERFRAFGLLFFAAAVAALVVLMGWGRAGWVPIFGMPGRYALLSVPGLCAVYFAWILYGPETTRNRTTIAFAIVVLLALPFNVRNGLAGGDSYVTGMRAFEQDLADGLSWQELGDRHYQFLLTWDRDGLVERMRMLHEAKIGPLGRAAPR